MTQKNAGYAVGAFGLLALFARALGGLLSDRVASARGSTAALGCFSPP